MMVRVLQCVLDSPNAQIDATCIFDSGALDALAAALQVGNPLCLVVQSLAFGRLALMPHAC